MIELRVRDIFSNHDTGVYFGVHTSDQYELFEDIEESGNSYHVKKQRWELGKRFAMARLVLNWQEGDCVIIDDEGKWAYGKIVDPRDSWENMDE